METAALAGLSLSIIDKLMDKIPDYSQRKREQYKNLKNKYLNEKNAEKRDDNLVDIYHDELIVFLEAFAKELKA